MKSLLKRLRLAGWTYRQSLSRPPRLKGAPVSDLFVWRQGAEWETFFELTDMPGLYAVDDLPALRQVLVKIFDSSGRLFAQQRIIAASYKRTILNISRLVVGCSDQIGTFAVFHSHTPKSIRAMGSFLAERGYVSYRYSGAPLRSYVHGNLDALSLKQDEGLDLLGGTSIRQREYRLQHELLASMQYQFVIVNSSNRPKKIIYEIKEVDDAKSQQYFEAFLPPCGCHLFECIPTHTSMRLVIHSSLIMARPIVFRLENAKLDVLHG